LRFWVARLNASATGLRARATARRARCGALHGSGSLRSTLRPGRRPQTWGVCRTSNALQPLRTSDAPNKQTHKQTKPNTQPGRYYAPSLKGKTLTKKLHAEVAAAFVARFGARAGWAHSVLFISDLRQSQALMAGAGD
jgi:hypothetical protein